jgi:hypothetical protein
LEREANSCEGSGNDDEEEDEINDELIIFLEETELFVGSYGNEGNSERGFERKEMLFSKDE